MVERPSGRICHGGWPPVRSLGSPSGSGVRAGQRSAVAHRSRSRGSPSRPATRHRRRRSMSTGAELSRLSLNQRTTASWSLPEAIQGCLDAGLGAIGIWREQLADVGLDEACRLVAESGLRVSSLCRGGFFTTADPAEAKAAEENNRAALEEAAALGAATLVPVPGGLPPGDKDLAAARDRAARAIERLVPPAREVGVRLGIEPMN